MDKRQGRISTKMIILIPVFILGIVSIISNVAAVGNIQRVNSNARQIADGYMKLQICWLLVRREKIRKPMGLPTAQ